MRSRFALTPASLVSEVAANDGYLLRYVRDAGIPCFGVEPTASTAAAARALGLEIVERFFGVALGQRARRRGQAGRPGRGQQRARPRPRHQRLRRRLHGAAQARRRRDLRVPAPAQAARGEPVRHRLPRALLVPVADARSQRVFERNGLAVFDVEAADDARRQPARLRPAARYRPARRRATRCDAFSTTKSPPA